MKFYKKLVVAIAIILLLGIGVCIIGETTVKAAGTIPSYYQLVSGESNVYYFDEIMDTNGRIITQYRLLDGDGKMYPSDAQGNKLSTTPVDFDAEKPQPNYYRSGSNFPNLVQDINHVEQNMVEYTFVGRYRFNFAATSSLVGSGVSYSKFLQEEKPGFPLKTYSTTPSDPGYQYDYRYGFSQPGSGTPKSGLFTTSPTNGVVSNGSYATLEQPTAEDGTLVQASNIRQAFLVMEAASDIASVSHKAMRDDMINRPMTLLGPSGGSMLSNGYLPEGYTSGGYSSSEPTIFYTKTAGNSRLRAVVVTDVTDFVRKEGYGKYYGYDIPGSQLGNIGDHTGHWKLIVIEEDPTMQKNRIGSILLGNVNSSSAAQKDATELAVSFGGYRTPTTGEIQGQFLFSSSGSNSGQNQCTVNLFPNAAVNDYVTLSTTSTPINRGFYNSKNSFGQSIIGLNGVRRENFSSSKVTTNTFPIDGTDFELLEIAVDSNGNSLQTTNHNAKLAHNAEAIKVQLPASTDGDNYIVAVGAFATVEMPVFESSVTHTEIETGIKGENIVAGNKVLVEMSTVNVTNSTSATVGLTATRATINVDTKLSDITDLSLIYYDYGANYNSATPGWDSSLGCVVRALTPVNTYAELEQSGLNYYYDQTNGLIYANVGVPIEVTATGGSIITKQLFNSRGDALNVRFTATSANAAMDITNSIRISGEDAVTSMQGIFELTPNEEYTYSTDVFDATSYPQLTKDAYLKDAAGDFTLHENGTKDVPYQVDIGREIQYKLTLKNIQDTAYSNILLTDTLPGGLGITPEQEAAIVSAGGTVSVANGIYTVSWPIATIAPEATEEIVFAATVVDNGIVLKNQASYTMETNTGTHKGVSNATYHIRKVKTLVISKQIRGDMSGVDLPFPVEITVKKGGANLVGETTAIKQREGFLPQQSTVTFANGTLLFTIYHGQTVSLELPVGWDYEVIEKLPTNNAKYNVYEPSLTGNIGTIQESAPSDGFKTEITNVTAPTLTKNAYINGSETADNGSATSPELVLSGNSIDYELIVKNETSSDRTGITVTDVLPTGLAAPTLDTQTGSASYNGSNRTVTWSNVTVPANGTVTLRIKTSVIANTDTTFTNIAQYTMNFNGKDITVESNNTVHQVVAGTLGIAKVIDNVRTQEDTKDFNFKITLSGSGVPSSLRYVISGPYADAGEKTMALSAGVGTFTLKHGQTLVFRSIPAGLTFKAEEIDPSSDGYYAVYSGIDADKNTGTASSVYQQLTVTNYHLPTIRKDAYINGAAVTQNGTLASPATVKPGDRITYKINIFNNSPDTAHTFTVQDVVPAGLSIVGDISDGGVESSGTITWANVAIPANETKELSFIASVDGANDYTNQINFQNTASYTALSGFTRTSNTTYHAIKPAILQVEKQVAKGSASEQFDIMVALGNPQQTDFIVEDTLSTNPYSPGSTSTTVAEIDTTLVFAEGKASLKLRNDEAIKLYVPQGMTYKVTEQLSTAQQSSWLPMYQNATGQMATTTITAKVTNYAYGEGDIALEKNAYIGTSTTPENGDSTAVGVDVGDTITYKLTLTNKLEVALAGVSVTDNLPAGLQIANEGISGTGSATEEDGVYTVAWNGITVPAAEGSTPGKVELSVKVNVLAVSGITEKLFNNTAVAKIPNVTADVVSNITKHKLNFYKASHTFASSSTAWTLPAGVIDLLPANIENLTKGDIANPSTVAQTTYQMPDGSGIWRFTEWDKTGEAVGTQDITFTGTWVFAADWYAVEYEFVHEDGLSTLPSQVQALLPAREIEYIADDVVTPKSLSQVLLVGPDVNSASTGTWKFNGWDKTTATVVDKNILFTGTWEFIADKFPLQYQFETSASIAVPEEVKALLPAPELYDLNEALDLATLPTEEVADTTNDGVWKFENFTASSATMTNQGMVATGVWEFVPNTYKSVYSFCCSGEEEIPDVVKDLLPQESTGHINTDIITPVEISTTCVEVTGGEWNFYGWDATDKTIDCCNVEFVGTWAFTPWYQVSYEFKSDTAGQTLPAALNQLLPQDDNYYPSGTELLPSVLSITSINVEGGTWNFLGWEQQSVTIAQQDITFVGKWAFVAEKIEPEPEPSPSEDIVEKPIDILNPSASPSSNTGLPKPLTGDSSSVGGYIVLMSACVLIVLLYVVCKKKKIGE